MMVKQTIRKITAGLSAAVFLATAIPFGSISQMMVNAASGIYGDVNEDGAVTELDITALTEAVESGTSAKDLPAADVDGDGSLTSSDVEWITAYVSGEVTYFPMGETCPSPYTYMTRGEWIHTLVDAFDMSFEDETGLVEYYSDLTDYTYKHDIDIAANYGVFDVISDEFDPEIFVTREFAAHTLNFCLGFENDLSCTFTDTESVYYQGDAQVALNRGWFMSVSGEFRPELYATETELADAIADMNSVLSDSEEALEETLVYSDEVIEINDAKSAELNGNIITVTGSSTAIAVGDIFAVPLSEDVTVVRKAEAVSKDSTTGVMTITYSELEENTGEEVVEEVVSEGDGYIDFDSLVSEEGVEFEVTESDEDEIATAADLATIQSDESMGILNRTMYTIAASASGTLKPKNKVIADLKTNVGGVSVTGTATLKNLRIPYKLDYKLIGGLNKLSFGVDADLETNITVSAKKSVTVPLGTIEVLTCGAAALQLKLSLNVSMEGKVSLTYTMGVDAGVEYTKKNGFRFTKSFQSKSLVLEAQIDAKVALKIAFALRVGASEIGNIYVQAGVKAQIKATVRSTALTCINVQGHLFAEVGAEIKFLGKKFSKSYEIWNKSNSPLKFIMHVENGSKVAKCTYDSNDPSRVATTAAKIAQSISADKINGSYSKRKGSTGYKKSYNYRSATAYNSYTIAFEEQTPPAEINEATTLTSDVTYNHNLNINADLDLNGYTLTVKGDVNHNGGEVTFNKGTFDVGGCYKVEGNSSYSYPSMTMADKNDKFTIGESFILNNSNPFNCTAGTMEVKEDILLYDYHFNSTNLHKIVLSGTKDQHFLANDVSGYNHKSNVNVVELKNSNSRKLKIEGGIWIDSGISTDGDNLSIECTEDFLEGKPYIRLGNCDTKNVSIKGDCSLGSFNFGGETVTSNGTIDIYSRDDGEYGYCILLNGAKWNHTGNLEYGSSGTLKLDGGELTVDGDLKLNNPFIMDNKKDIVRVTGSLYKYSGYDTLTNGVLYIGEGIYAEAEIKFSEAHRTVLTGEKDIDLYFKQMTSTLNYLIIENSDKRKITVDGYLRANYTDCGEKPLSIIANDIPGMTGSLSLGELTCTELNVEGDVNFYNNNDFKGSKITVNGDPYIGGTFNLNSAELVFKENLIQNDGTLDLSTGKVVVPENLTQHAGTLNVNGASLEVKGDVELKGTIKMENEKGLMNVLGNWDSTFENDPTITAGTISVAGDFTDFAEQCFYSGGTSNFILSGDKDQTVKIAYGKSESYHSVNQFETLYIKNADSRNIILKGMLQAGEIRCDGKLVNIISDGGIISKAKLRTPLNITGDIFIDATTHYFHDSDEDIFDLNGYMVKIDGNVYQNAGSVKISTGMLDITGDYFIVNDEDTAVYTPSDGFLVMTNDSDYVRVGGDFITATNQNHSQYLKAGVLEIKGDFLQMDDGTTFAFPASGTHTAYLSGEGKQSVTFESYDDSHFNRLVLAKDKSNYTFSPDVCWTELAENETITTPSVKVTAETTKSTVATTTTTADSTVSTDDVTTTKATTVKVVTAEVTTTAKETTADDITTVKATTVKVVTAEVTTTAKATTADDVTTVKATTVKVVTAEVTTTAKATTVKVVTAEVTTTAKVVTAEVTTTAKATTADDVTTVKATTAKATTAEVVTTNVSNTDIENNAVYYIHLTDEKVAPGETAYINLWTDFDSAFELMDVSLYWQEITGADINITVADGVEIIDSGEGYCQVRLSSSDDISFIDLLTMEITLPESAEIGEVYEITTNINSVINSDSADISDEFRVSEGLLTVCEKTHHTDDGFDYIKVDEDSDGTEDYVTITGYYSYDATEVVIPAEIDELPVKVIGEYAFSYNETLTSVIIPETVDTIGKFAFANIDNLESIVVPENVTFIDYAAFACCKSLDEITIENSDCVIEVSAETICNELNDDYELVYNGTIYGNENSTAQIYAEENGYAFEIIGSNPVETTTETVTTTPKTTTTVTKINETTDVTTESAVIPGDINGDGKATIKDAKLLNEMLLNGEDIPLESGDINGDGDVNTADLVALCLNIAEETDRDFDDVYNEACAVTSVSVTTASTASTTANAESSVVTTSSDKSAVTTTASEQSSVTTTVSDESPVTTTVIDGSTLGDANLDGKLNVRDCATIAVALAKGNSDTLPVNADFNGDGKINVRDAAAIAKKLASGYAE